MTFTKLSDDYSDDTWQLSDAAFRLHTEALIWQARKLLDCRIPKSDLRHFKCGDRETVQELLDLGFWSDIGDSLLILHQSQYQRTRASVVAQQTRNQLNGMKSAGRPRSGGSREIWKPSPSPKTHEATQSETHLGSKTETQVASRAFRAEHGEHAKISEIMGEQNPHGSPDGNPEGMAFNRSSSESSGNLALDPDAWPTTDEAVTWRAQCEEQGVQSMEQLARVSGMDCVQARKVWLAAYPGRRY